MVNFSMDLRQDHSHRLMLIFENASLKAALLKMYFLMRGLSDAYSYKKSNP